jgi:hypothetical protein
MRARATPGPRPARRAFSARASSAWSGGAGRRSGGAPRARPARVQRRGAHGRGQGRAHAGRARRRVRARERGGLVETSAQSSLALSWRGLAGATITGRRLPARAPARLDLVRFQTPRSRSGAGTGLEIAGVGWLELGAEPCSCGPAGWRGRAPEPRRATSSCGARASTGRARAPRARGCRRTLRLRARE